ncbi:MAG TPA: outer membrane beta-barrel protein [Vicinamibacteria bacterium]
MTRPSPWILPALLALAPAAALAQVGTTNITQESVEIAPFVGIRTGGSLSGQLDGTARDFAIESGTSYGGTLDFNLHRGNFKFEVLYSRQSTQIEQAVQLVPGAPDLNVEYLQGGVLQEVGNEKSRFFVSVLAGATRFAPQGFDSETKFSLSLGGGLKFFPSRHIGLRFDARAYMTFIKADTGAFCVNGACLFSYSGSHLWQGDFTAGLILAF